MDIQAKIKQFNSAINNLEVLLKGLSKENENTISGKAATIENQLKNINPLLKEIICLLEQPTNKLNNIEKKELWNSILTYKKFANSFYDLLTVQLKILPKYHDLKWIHARKKTSLNNIDKIVTLSTQFTMQDIYQKNLIPIPVSMKNTVPTSNSQNASVLDQIIKKASLKMLTDIVQSKKDMTSELVNIFLEDPENIHNYQLQINKNTHVQTIEYRNPNLTDKWLIAIGGAGAAYTNILATTKTIADNTGCNFLILDYLAKKPNSFRDPIDIIVTGANYLCNKEQIKPENLTLIGHSNGGRIALEAANSLPGCNVITNNTYTSLEEVITDHIKNQNTLKDPLTKIKFDQWVNKLFANAFIKTGNEYHSFQTKDKIADHKYASIYTAPDTASYKRENNTTKTIDNILFNAVDGKQRAKLAKHKNKEWVTKIQTKGSHLTETLNTLYENQNIREKNKEIIGISCKDYPNPIEKNHCFVFKGVAKNSIVDLHNIIDPSLISTAMMEIEKNKDFKHLSLNERFENLLRKYHLTAETDDQLTPAGIELKTEDILLLEKIIEQLNNNPDSSIPTQNQLMRLFQSSSDAAKLISQNIKVLDRMIKGNKGFAEYKCGMNFLNKCIQSLDKRTTEPDSTLSGNGAYLDRKAVKEILESLQAYQAANPVQRHGFFSGRSNTRMISTVSDLNLVDVFLKMPC
ncbi:MAG: hypothetical protein LEGION0398_MBIBDBAK_00446 [Legionellaceae bacterium]